MSTTTENRQWCSARTFTHPDQDANAQAVLTASGSLVRFLQNRFGMHLSVAVSDQEMDKCTSEEAGLLECSVGTPCLRRKASLIHRRNIMFDAESVLPFAYLTTDLMEALEAGKEPLGKLLFEYGMSLSRADLCVGQGNHPILQTPCWSRRSVLRTQEGPRALVNEHFRLEMWAHLRQLQRQKEQI